MTTERPSQAERPQNRYPDTDNFPTGPEIGDPLPDFTLPDQHGTPINYSAVRGNGKALVVFHRSARW